MRNKTGVLIGVLIFVIAVLLLIVIYAFVVKPAIINYQVTNQNQGINYAVGTIIQQIQQNGYAQIPVGNQTLILVPLQPSQTTNSSASG